MKYIFILYLISTSLLYTSCITAPVENGLGGYISDEEEFNNFVSPSSKAIDSLN